MIDHVAGFVWIAIGAVESKRRCDMFTSSLEIFTDWRLSFEFSECKFGKNWKKLEKIGKIEKVGKVGKMRSTDSKSINRTKMSSISARGQFKEHCIPINVTVLAESGGAGGILRFIC